MPSAEPLPLLAPCSMPYCKGCSHGLVVRALAAAMEDTGLPPERLCLVSDIGCVGLIDRLFPTVHTVHTTHGRSTAFASGLAMADGVLCDGALKIIVVIGDGGATIGLLHLVAAAQLNVDVTVIVHNNHLYGMTGGQASGLTPEDWITATTPVGNPLPPLDLIGVLRSSGATFLAREMAMNRGLADRISEAIAHPGFAVVEVMELCTAFGVPLNKLNGKKLKALAEETGEPLGLRVHLPERPSFRRAWAGRYAGNGAGPGWPEAHLTPRSAVAPLDRPLCVVVAGTAGERVQSAATLVARTAVAEGLFATQKKDNPVTQGTGFSVSELIVSAEPIHYTGIPQPDAVVVASQVGWDYLCRGGVPQRLGEDGLLVADEGIDLGDFAERAARLPLRSRCRADGATLAGLGWLACRRDVLSLDALVGAAERAWGDGADRSVAALRWGFEAGAAPEGATPA